MNQFLEWAEAGALSIWVRESAYAFQALVVLHTLGMGVVVGIAGAIDLRILGVAKGVPIQAMGRFLPFFWGALIVNAASGVLLLVGYPTKGLTNPLFYAKLAFIAVAVWTVVAITRRVLRDPEASLTLARRLAATSLLLWAAAIFAGRFLAYTFTRLLQGMPEANYY